MMGQVQKATRAENPEYPATGKIEKTGTSSPRVTFPPLAYGWSLGFDPPLTFLPLAGC